MMDGHQTLIYAIGHVCNDLFASVWFTYMIIYMQWVLQFDAHKAGTAFFVGQFADAISTPLIGYLCDRARHTQLPLLNNRRFWYAIGNMLTVISFPIIFHQCLIKEWQNDNGWWSLAYYCVFIVIFQVGWAAVQVSHLAMIPELTPLDNDRVKLTAYRYSFTVLSNIFVYLLAYTFFIDGATNIHEFGPDDFDKFRLLVSMLTLIGLFTSGVFLVSMRDVSPVNHEQPIPAPRRRPVFGILRDHKLYLVACTYTMARMFVNVSQVFIALFAHDSLRVTQQWYATVPLTIYLSSYVATKPVHVCNRVLGRTICFLLGGVLGVAACLAIYFIKMSYQSDIYLIAVLLGMSSAFLLVTSLSLTADLIGPNVSNGAFIYGFMSFFDKISNGLIVVLIQFLHTYYLSGDEYYRYVLTLVCGIAAITCFVSSMFVSIDQLEANVNNECINSAENDNSDFLRDNSDGYLEDGSDDEIWN